MCRLCVCVCNALITSVCVLQSLVTLDGGKLVHVQKWDGKETSLVREVTDNTLLLVSRRYLCSCFRGMVCVCIAVRMAGYVPAESI